MSTRKSKSNKKFYITTSIAYTNANPHLGFALESVQADVLARYHRVIGDDVFFLTGTDEYGIKNARSAKKNKKTPTQFTNEISKKFIELKQILNLSNDDFIRTTDREKHWPGVEKTWLNLKKNKDIYKKQYKGLYCSGCEAFITEKDLVDGKCPIHQKEPEQIEEENYFFQLSRYSKKIEKAIESDKIKIIPAARKKEILNFIKSGLNDISFSRMRKNLEWGIPVPGDKTQTIYVWGDALVNYISALGYQNNSKKFQRYWPADVHCIGKDILKFHCAIWLGMLLSLKLKLPKIVFVHGFITSDKQKMSKSLGNVVNPDKLVEKYGTDAVRYFLLREIPPTKDGDYTQERFEDRYNADLAKGLGNFSARTLALSGKHKSPAFVETTAGQSKTKNQKVNKEIKKIWKNYKRAMDEFKFNIALEEIWKLIGFCDRYIEKEKPWEQSKNQLSVIQDLMIALSNVAEMLAPFLPETSKKILKQIKSKSKGKPLFPRI
jgi:methionyl-tRNA synthetase